VFLRAIVPYRAETRKDLAMETGSSPEMKTWDPPINEGLGEDPRVMVVPQEVVKEIPMRRDLHLPEGLGEDLRVLVVPQEVVEEVEEVPRRTLEEEQEEQDPWRVVGPRKGSRVRKPVEKYIPAPWGRLGALRDEQSIIEGLGEDPRFRGAVQEDQKIHEGLGEDPRFRGALQEDQKIHEGLGEDPRFLGDLQEEQEEVDTDQGEQGEVAGPHSGQDMVQPSVGPKTGGSHLGLSLISDNSWDGVGQG
jgi:hypothetical protein